VSKGETLGTGEEAGKNCTSVLKREKAICPANRPKGKKKRKDWTFSVPCKKAVPNTKEAKKGPT